MTLPAFDQFKNEALAAGFDEVLERRCAPQTGLETHSHPFYVDGWWCRAKCGSRLRVFLGILSPVMASRRAASRRMRSATAPTAPTARLIGPHAGTPTEPARVQQVVVFREMKKAVSIR
jgi:hypothetical protein